jgi:hypothetical protein
MKGLDEITSLQWSALNPDFSLYILKRSFIRHAMMIWTDAGYSDFALLGSWRGVIAQGVRVCARQIHH